jgi:hypothetical protein
MARPQKYPEEVIWRGIRLVFDSGRPISHVAHSLVLPAETLRKRSWRGGRAGQSLRALRKSERRPEPSSGFCYCCSPLARPGAGAVEMLSGT